MRNAETILNIIRERGRRRLPLEDVYRQLYNPDLYLLAYGRIATNAGALTPGVTSETADGMTLDTIHHIIALLRQERYRFAPVRRIHIPKPHSTKRRPLGLPTWSDKLVQEVIRLILEAYYDPQFSTRSHGFRPGRGCHTALTEIARTWPGTIWFIEGDITGCFDHLDHEVLLNILAEDLHDQRFLRLIRGLLTAGYLEDWRYHRTLSGSPQGGVVSPILANIYLDRLDRYVENVLMPEFTRGTKRRDNPEYLRRRGQYRQQVTRGDRAAARILRQHLQATPSKDPQDPDHRRLRYLRYADDFLLGFAGPRVEAEEITQRLRAFLRDALKLELSETKTKLTHGRTDAARFLGYDITVLHNDQKRTRRRDNGVKVRSISGRIGLKVPLEVVRERCRPYLQHGQPIHRKERTHDDVLSIIMQYESEFRGLAEYYQLAYNRYRLYRLKWVMQVSLTKTLAHKLGISVRQVYRRYRTTIQTARGPKVVLQATRERDGKPPLVATWGRVDLARKPTARLNDDPTPVWNRQTALVQRLLAETCELCGSQEQVEVHHIKALKQLQQPGRRARPAWVEVMAARQRKTLVVCRLCHQAIHAGRSVRTTKTTTGDWRAG